VCVVLYSYTFIFLLAQCSGWLTARIEPGFLLWFGWTDPLIHKNNLLHFTNSRHGPSSPETQGKIFYIRVFCTFFKASCSASFSKGSFVVTCLKKTNQLSVQTQLLLQWGWALWVAKSSSHCTTLQQKSTNYHRASVSECVCVYMCVYVCAWGGIAKKHTSRVIHCTLLLTAASRYLKPLLSSALIGWLRWAPPPPPHPPPLWRRWGGGGSWWFKSRQLPVASCL